MPETTTDLYRRGSASSPRLDHVRVGKDIDAFERDSILWVRGRSGGVSTFSRPGFGPHWWRLSQGYIYPGALDIVNDHGHHYSWEPNVDMPLATYGALLAAVHPHFIKVT